MKIVKATNVTEMKQSLCGRDAKVLLENALKHIPHLLEFVNLDKSDVEGAVRGGDDGSQDEPQAHAQKRALDDNDGVFDWEPGEGEEEVQEEDICNVMRIV